jgi:hypothetical protein
MSSAVARRISSAWSRKASRFIVAPGGTLRAKVSHSVRISSTFLKMNSASRIGVFLRSHLLHEILVEDFPHVQGW